MVLENEITHDNDMHIMVLDRVMGQRGLHFKHCIIHGSMELLWLLKYSKYIVCNYVESDNNIYDINDSSFLRIQIFFNTICD